MKTRTCDCGRTIGPMTVYDESRGGEHLRYIIVGPGGCNQPIAYGVSGADPEVFEKIAQAVNAYDDLMLLAAGVVRLGDKTARPGFEVSVEELQSLARTAIAKAKG